MKKIVLVSFFLLFAFFLMTRASEYVLPSGKIIDSSISLKNNSSNNEKKVQRKIYLKRNREQNVNKLVQAMFSEANAKYVIRYHYMLGENITLPENCSLSFDGGSIRGKHTLTGKNTRIETDIRKIINTDVTLTGTWDVIEAYPEWFGANGKGVNDDTDAIQSCLNTFDVVYFPNKKYNITQIFPKSNQIIRFSDGCTLNASRLLKPTTSGVPGESMIKIFQKHNVFIEGNNVIMDMRKNAYQDHVTGDGSGGYERHCVSIQASQGITLKQINANNALGDGFCLRFPQGGNNVDITIIGCTGNNNTRQGLSIVDGTNVVVEGCTFSNTDGASNGPWAGIDIEPNYFDHGYKINNIHISNCRFINNKGAGVLIANSLYDDGTNRDINITVKDCVAENCNCGISLQNFTAYQANGSIKFENYKVQGLVFANVGCWGGNSNLPVYINNCSFEKTITLENAFALQNSAIVVGTSDKIYDSYIGDIHIKDLKYSIKTAETSKFIIIFNPKHTGMVGKVLKNFSVENIIIDKSMQFAYYTGFGPVFHATKFDKYENFQISFSIPISCGDGFSQTNYQSIHDVLFGNGGNYYLMDYKKMPGMVVRYIKPEGVAGICTFMINDEIPIYSDKHQKLKSLSVKDPAGIVANGREISTGEYIEFTAKKEGWVITDMSSYMRSNLVDMDIDR